MNLHTYHDLTFDGFFGVKYDNENMTLREQDIMKELLWLQEHINRSCDYYYKKWRLNEFSEIKNNFNNLISAPKFSLPLSSVYSIEHLQEYDNATKIQEYIPQRIIKLKGPLSNPINKICLWNFESQNEVQTPAS